MRTFLSVYTVICILVMLPQCQAIAAVIHVPGDVMSIQQAIDIAETGDSIIVSDGTYTGAQNRNITFRGKSLSLTSVNGPEMTIIDCDYQGRGFIFENRECRRAQLTGFTVINGSALHDTGNRMGGGIYCIGSSPEISHCIISQGSAYEGAGIYIEDGAPIIVSTLITLNTQAMVGGGVSIRGGSPWLIDTTISSNTVNSNGDSVFGGGLNISDSNARVTNCIITKNSAVDGSGSHAFGGGCQIRSTDYFTSVFTNCLIIENSAVQTTHGNGGYGGGVCVIDGDVLFNSCTFSENHAGTNGGPIYAEAASDVQLQNCVSWNNSPPGIHGASRVRYSDIESGYSGAGNIDADPLFTQGNLGNYYLSHTAAGQTVDSPCVDAGNRAANQVCYQVSDGKKCLNTLNTRTDDINDAGTVDMGYHYPSGSTNPTPTPVPTSQPFHCTTTGVSLWMESHTFRSGDPFTLMARLCNLQPVELQNYQLIVVLLCYDELFFFPQWTSEFSGYSMDITSGLTEFEVIHFTVPDDISNISGTMFLSFLMNADFSEQLGNASLWNFSFVE